MKPMRSYLCLGGLLLLGGCCSNPDIQNMAQEKDGALVASFDAKKRAIILLKTGTHAYVCPEAPPDVATEIASEFNSALKLAISKFSADASVANKISETFKQISPTTEATTYLRSSLAEYCWISINSGFTQQQTADGVKDILASARGLAFREVAIALTNQLATLPKDQNYPAASQEILAALKLLLVQSGKNPKDVVEAAAAFK